MENANEKKRAFRTVDLAYIAMSAVLITICSWINIPAMVPFTLQTFAVFFVLTLFGGKRGLMAVLVYLILGAVGVPVFAYFTSGIGILFGDTGGYMVGFILMALIYWLVECIFKNNKLWIQIAALAVGMIVCYAFGTAWFMVIYAQSNDAVSLAVALTWCVTPFIIPDTVKLAAAVTAGRRLSKILKLK